MHIGNIFSYLITWLLVRWENGRIILRIDDLDPDRSKDTYAQALPRDFETLGLTWDNEEIAHQNNRTEIYREAYDHLATKNLMYPCFCTRADLHSAGAPHASEQNIYPGTCSVFSLDDAKEAPAAIRLRVPDESLSFVDLFQGVQTQNLKHSCGDFVIRRKDGVYAYQLATVVDDYLQDINLVSRGYDLLSSVPRQLYLRTLLYTAVAPEQTFAHVPLLVNASDRRLSKRDGDVDIEGLIAHFGSVERLYGALADITGILKGHKSLSLDDLLEGADLSVLEGVHQITWPSTFSS